MDNKPKMNLNSGILNFSHNMELDLQGTNEAQENNKELLVMTVEIGDGRQDVIAVHEHDDPADLARAFSEKHGLEPELQQSLIALIRENKEIIKKKERNANDGQSVDWMASNSSKHHPSGPKQPKKGTVYDRIYQQLKKNNISPTNSTSELNKSKSASNFNYGEYLYVRGMKKKEDLKKTSELKQQALVDSELPELTFSPLINKNASVISPRASDKTEEGLRKKGQEYQEKLNKLKLAQDDEKYKECKFTPKINSNARNNREKDTKIYDNLYSQAEKLKEKQLKKTEEEIKQFSFKPDVKLTKKKGTKETKEQVFDRLDSTKKLQEEELERIRREKNEKDTDETGHKLFKPMINSSSEKRMTQTTVWDLLYSRSDMKKRELEDMKSEQQRSLEAASSAKKSCENSDKIFHDFRLRQYQRLFRALDNDYDGVISAEAIRIDQIDVKALEILTPFFEELQATSAKLDFDQFCGKMDVLCKGLNVAQRSLLLKNNNKAEEEEPERKPFISQNSMALAEKKRSTLPSDMYERLTTANKMTEMRIQKIKEEREKEHSKECTFKPALKSN